MNKKIESNIWKLYVIKALRWFLLIMPIVVLFYQENGLSMKEVLLLQALFSVAVIIFEIPSGYFSDIIGRKTTIIVASFLSFIGFAVYSVSYGFYGLLIAELILGLGSSLLSGTDSALLYDTLVFSNREHEYKKIEGKMMSVGNFSEGIASFFGGFIALASLRTPFYFETFLIFFTIPMAFTLIEPPRQKLKNKDGAFKEILKIVKYSIHGNKEIKWLIFYSGFIGASTLTMVWFIQPYFTLVGLPLAYFGIAWGILNLLVGVFALYAHKIELFVGRKNALISLIFISFIGYTILGLLDSLWAIIFIALFYFVRGINGPILKDYVNKLISSDMRATVLSVKNLFGRLVFAIIGPFVGWLSDVYSLQFALISSGSIFLFFGIITLLFLHKHKAL